MIKFKAAWIHFLKDVFVALVVVKAKASPPNIWIPLLYVLSKSPHNNGNAQPHSQCLLLPGRDGYDWVGQDHWQRGWKMRLFFLAQQLHTWRVLLLADVRSDCGISPMAGNLYGQKEGTYHFRSELTCRTPLFLYCFIILVLSKTVRFHTNPCKFRNFQTAVKYFLKLYGSQISFLIITGNLSPVIHKGKIWRHWS